MKRFEIQFKPEEERPMQVIIADRIVQGKGGGSSTMTTTTPLARLKSPGPHPSSAPGSIEYCAGESPQARVGRS